MLVDGGIASFVLNRAQQAWCGLHGHDNLLQFERDRMFLRCATCGHESPGWDVSESAVACRSDDGRQPALVRTHLLRARRAA